MDLSDFTGESIPILGESRSTKKGYDRIDVELHEEKEINPVTKEEEYRVVEDIVFKRLGTDKSQEKNAFRTYVRLCREGKNVDQKRQRIIFDFVKSINTVAVSDRFIRALVKLPKVVDLSNKTLLYIIRVLAYSIDRLTLPEETVEILQKFADSNLHSTTSETTREALKYLYIKTISLSADNPKTKYKTYNSLVLSLIILITLKKGDLEKMKTSFFAICADLKEYERNELLILFGEAGVKISKNLVGKSEELEKYKSAKSYLSSFPVFE